MPPKPPTSTPRILALLGFGPQLRRRTDGSQRLDYFIGATVGVISGAYMFNEPIAEYFQEQREKKEGSALSDNNNTQQKN